MKSTTEKVRSALAWNTAFHVFRDTLQFAIMLALVRLLEPEAYGQSALVSNTIAFLSLFSINLFVAHTLQVAEEAGTNYQDHFTAGALLNVTLAVLTNLVAWALRYTDGYASVAPLLHVASLNFILDWPTQFYCRMLEREMAFKRLRLLHATGAALAAALSVAMAFAGFGAYSLVVPTLAITLPFLIDLFLGRRWRPTWQWSWDRYRPAASFAMVRIGSGLAYAGRHLLESSVLSGTLGFAAFGIVNRSFGLAQLLCYKLSVQLFESVYPALPRVGAADASRIGGLLLRVVGWSVIPTATVFGGLSLPVVLTIYGDKWVNVVPMLPWAMAWGAAMALHYAAYMLLLARHQHRMCLAVDVLGLAVTAASLFFALPHGAAVYLASLAIGLMVNTVIALRWLVACKGIEWSGVYAALAPPLLGAGLAFSGATAVVERSGPTRDSVLGAILWGMLFVVLYAATLRILFRSQLAALVERLPGRSAIRRLLILPT